MLMKIATAVMALGLAASAGADGSHRGSSDRDDFRFYTCRAESLTHEGIFFLGMGRSYGEAYARAAETCHRQRMECRITCSLNF